MKTMLAGIVAALALIAATVLLLDAQHVSSVRDSATAAVHVEE